LAVSYRQGAKIWDLQQRAVVHTFRGHADNVRFANFSPEGDRLGTTGHKQDRTVRIWDISQEKELFCFKDHTAEVPYAEFSPDGKRVVTAGCDGTARVWEPETGKVIAVLERRFAAPYVSRSRFSKDGRQVVSSAHEDGRAFVWNAETG